MAAIGETLAGIVWIVMMVFVCLVTLAIGLWVVALLFRAIVYIWRQKS
jgi:hypothetical protein